MHLKSFARRQSSVADLRGWAQATTADEVGLAIADQIQSNLATSAKWVTGVTGDSDVQLLGMRLELAWNKNLRITHCAPVGKKVMWGSKYDAERSQQVNPGFRGRVWFLYNKSPESVPTLVHTRFHTGTGGYGSYGGPFTPGDGYPLSYDCQLFAEDWPVLREATEVEIAMRRVADDRSPITLNFEWRAEHDERS